MSKYRDVVPGAERNHIVLDGSHLQEIKDLVARDPMLAGDSDSLGELVNTEVAYTEKTNLPVRDEPLEGAEGLLQGDSSRPMQHVQIKPIRFQSPQRPLAGLQCPLVRCIFRNHLGGQKDPFAPTFNRLGDQLFDRTLAVEFRRVEDRRPRVDATPKRFDSASTVVEFHLPCALADNRKADAGPAECSLLHHHL